MASKERSFKFEDDRSVESLVGMFSCFICMEKLKDARICPHCSKLCCYECIHQWLSQQNRQQCPYCRANLHLHEMVKCRWGEEVNQHLDSLQTSPCTAAKEMDSEYDKCLEHKEKMSVYCDTCKKCLCHKCALWGDRHPGHLFKPLQDVYEEHSAQIRKEMDELKKRQSELTRLTQDMILNEKTLQDVKEKRVNDIMKAVDLVLDQLESELKDKFVTVTARKTLLTAETEQIQALLLEIDRKLESCTASELIDQSSELSQEIHQLYKEPIQSFLITPVPADFKSGSQFFNKPTTTGNVCPANSQATTSSGGAGSLAQSSSSDPATNQQNITLTTITGESGPPSDFQFGASTASTQPTQLKFIFKSPFETQETQEGGNSTSLCLDADHNRRGQAESQGEPLQYPPEKPLSVGNTSPNQKDKNTRSFIFSPFETRTVGKSTNESGNCSLESPFFSPFESRTFGNSTNVFRDRSLEGFVFTPFETRTFGNSTNELRDCSSEATDQSPFLSTAQPFRFGFSSTSTSSTSCVGPFGTQENNSLLGGLSKATTGSSFGSTAQPFEFGVASTSTSSNFGAGLFGATNNKLPSSGRKSPALLERKLCRFERNIPSSGTGFPFETLITPTKPTNGLMFGAATATSRPLFAAPLSETPAPIATDVTSEEPLFVAPANITPATNGLITEASTNTLSPVPSFEAPTSMIGALTRLVLETAATTLTDHNSSNPESLNSVNQQGGNDDTQLANQGLKDENTLNSSVDDVLSKTQVPFVAIQDAKKIIINEVAGVTPANSKTDEIADNKTEETSL